MADFDLTKLPDELLPGPTDLPGELSFLANLIGIRAVLILEKHCRGTHICIHNLDKLRNKLRDQWIRSEYDRMLEDGEKNKVARLARATGRCERTVKYVLGRVDDEPEESAQARMF